MVNWNVGYGASALDLNQLANIISGNYVVSGCSPSDGTNAMEVDIASGEVYLDGSSISVSTQTVTLTSSNSDPRKDVIYIDSSGTANVVDGTAAPAEPSAESRFSTYHPSPPDLVSTTGVLIAEIWVGGGVSDIGSSDIRDRTQGASNSHDQLINVSTDDHHIRPIAGSYLADSSDTFNVQVGSGVKGDGSDNLTIEPADFAGFALLDDGSDNLAVSAGDYLGDDGSGSLQLQDGATMEGDGSGLLEVKERVSYDPGHTEWEDGLATEEIWQMRLQSGETFVVERIEFREKGGGSSTSAEIDVRDNSAGTVIGSQTLGGATKDPGSSGSGNEVLVRLTNSTGGPIQANPRVVGYITGAH